MIYIWITVVVFTMDFIIKRYVDKTFELKIRHPKLKNKIIIEKYYNKGAALNFMAKRPGVLRSIQTLILIIVGIAYYCLLRVSGKGLCKTGIALLAGGGLSNLYDRYTKGHVVDYFRINAGPKRLRTVVFNISDFFIFIGAILAVIGDEAGTIVK